MTLMLLLGGWMQLKRGSDYFHVRSAQISSVHTRALQHWVLLATYLQKFCTARTNCLSIHSPRLKVVPRLAEPAVIMATSSEPVLPAWAWGLGSASVPCVHKTSWLHSIRC